MFAGCTSLESVTIGDAVTEIGAQAFSLTIITTIDIPASVESIATEGFYNTAIETINIHKAEGSITGAPWSATNATINWNV